MVKIHRLKGDLTPEISGSFKAKKTGASIKSVISLTIIKINNNDKIF